MTTSMTEGTPRRAVGIVRVSRTRGRDGDSFASPAIQRDRIADLCAREHLLLVASFDEMDVSGGLELDRRDGLRAAVEAVEAGRADVIVVAYFDRLVRSLVIQAELLHRVEVAGGAVLAADIGEVSAETTAKWLNATMHGMVAEYHKHISGEKSREAQEAAIARGVAPWPRVPPGYVRADDRRLVPDPTTRDAVVGAFEMRAGGATVATVREHLRAAGIERSYHGVLALLQSRVVLGELHFGDYEPNLKAWEPIVDRVLWNSVQRVRVPRGRKAKSDRLLARQGVLRCATCGARMVVGSANHGAYAIYRCPPTGDCARRVTIAADVAERVVVEAARSCLDGIVGVRSVRENVRAARARAADAQSALDSAIRAFDGLADEPVAVERLTQLRQARDDARSRAEQVDDGSADDVLLFLDADWDQLSLVNQQRAIKATVKAARVAPAHAGSPGDRVEVELWGFDLWSAPPLPAVLS